MGANLSIFQKGLLLVAVPLLAQLLFLGVLGKLQYDASWDEHWAMHTKDVIAQTQAVYLHLVEAQAAVEGLVLSGDATYSGPYHEATNRLHPELEALEHLVSDNRVQHIRTQTLRERADELLAWLAEQDNLVRSGRRTEAVARSRGQGGQRLLAVVRDEARAFLRDEEQLDAAREAALRRTSGWLGWALAGGGALAVLSTVVLALIFSRGVVRRLASLGDNAKRLAEGQAMTEPLRGRDEIAQVDAAFRALAASLQHKTQENELFVYSVSHDLRSPLVNLQGFSKELDLACADLRRILDQPEVPSAVRTRAHAILDDNAAEATRFIQTAVSRLSRIIDALLRLSRAGRVEYRPQSVDLGVVVGRVVEALRGTVAERRAEVVVKPLPPCWGDPTAIEQVFANLIGNALNYLDPARPGKVEIGVVEAAPGDKMNMRTYFIRDNGLGIPTDYVHRLFTGFQRLHGDVAPGEGMGLALVRRVVERHGGRIWVEPNPGAGSTFYLALPAGPPEGLTGLAAPAIAPLVRESAA